jgi:hypothetical protein
VSSAFPPDRMAACGLPYIEAVAGDLVLDCTICETVLRPIFNPIIPFPYPPSFDFGCYPFSIDVDFDPLPVAVPEFEVDLLYRTSELSLERPDPQVGYCKPKLKFKVRLGGGCGNVTVMVLADTNIVLFGCQTIDGIAVCDDDLVLAIAQTDPLENDIWIVKSDVWLRYETVLMCNSVVVRFGDEHAREIWRMENTTEPEHGVDTLIWAPTSVVNIACRLRQTDATEPLDGVQLVDGKNTEDGDFIAVDYGAAGPSTFNGVWIAKDVGPWTQLYATEYTGDPAIPVLAPGSIVTVWDGYSSPWLYVVGTQYYVAP